MDLIPQNVTQRTEKKYWEPQEIHSRYLAIMELMLARPDMNQNQIAESLGYNAARLSVIVNTPLFKLAFNEYRREHMRKVSDLIADATVEAIQFHQQVMKGKIYNDDGTTREVDDVQIRQMSARDILAQGHAKAADKHIGIGVTANAEQLEVLAQVMKEFKSEGK